MIPAIAAAGSAALGRITELDRVINQDGTSCANPMKLAVSWTNNSFVTDAYTLTVTRYTSISGGVWPDDFFSDGIVKTETSPASVTSFIDPLYDYKVVSGGTRHWYRYEARLYAPNGQLVQTMLAFTFFANFSGLCPL